MPHLQPCARCRQVLIPTGTGACPLCRLDYESTRDEPVRASGRRSPGWRNLARTTLERDETCTRCRHAPSKYAVHLDGLAPNDDGGLDPERVVGMCSVCKASYRRVLARRGVG
jgi:hypothetical protein